MSDTNIIIIHNKTYPEYLAAVIFMFRKFDVVKLQSTTSQPKLDIVRKIEEGLYTVGIRSRKIKEYSIPNPKDPAKEMTCRELEIYKIPPLKDNIWK